MRLIDVHGHLSPPGEKGGGPPALRDPEAAIERKRELGIEWTVIGSPVGAGTMLPLPGVDNYTQTADQVKAHNELMAEHVSRYPEALRTYAYVDPFGGAAMLDQARELLSDWRFVGLVVNTSVNGTYLSSPRAEDFFALANELRVPVLLHPPARPVGADSLTDAGLVEHVGRFCDVTTGVAAIVMAGWLDMFPHLVLVAAAGGGALALLPEKLDQAAQRGEPRNAAQRGGPGGPPPAARPLRAWVGEPPVSPPSAALRNVYVDTTSPSSHAFAANVATFGADHVLFGTDAPPLMSALEPAVRMVSGLSPEDRERVSWRNAASLYGISLEVHSGR
jgi:predicted TIM-barrel fold metal-dependent hydrolase